MLVRQCGRELDYEPAVCSIALQLYSPDEKIPCECTPSKNLFAVDGTVISEGKVKFSSHVQALPMRVPVVPPQMKKKVPLDHSRA